MEGHRNLCEYAEDSYALYRLWDNDLKKTIRKRQVSEFLGFGCLAVGIYCWWIEKPFFTVLGLAIGFQFLFNAVKYFIDESNTNYLMHRWDLEEALDRLRQHHAE